MPNRHEHGVPGQPHLQFVTHVELDAAIQAIQAEADQALEQSQMKTGRIDLLSQVVAGIQDAVAGIQDRFARLEEHVAELETRLTVVEATLVNQQEQIDALSLLFS